MVNAVARVAVIVFVVFYWVVLALEWTAHKVGARFWVATVLITAALIMSYFIGRRSEAPQMTKQS